jgi:hypothetical protein
MTPVAYTSSDWSAFAGAHVAASAALLGLVFVGLTINLREVVGSRLLVNRAAEAVILLGIALLTSSAVLTPGQSRDALSAELIVLGVATLGIVWMLQLRITMQPQDPGKGGPPPVSVLVRRILGLGAPVLLVLAGVTLAATAGGGLYWWSVAVLVSYVGALTDAWVLLIEILR